MIRLTKGVYMVGSKRRGLAFKKESILVRCGGGFMLLPEFLDKYENKELLALHREMKLHNEPITQVVERFLD